MTFLSVRSSLSNLVGLKCYWSLKILLQFNGSQRRECLWFFSLTFSNPKILECLFLRLIVKCEKFNFLKILGRLVNGHLEKFNRPPAVENLGNIHFSVQIFNKKQSLGARTCRPTILVKTFGTLCFRAGKCNSSTPPPPPPSWAVLGVTSQTLFTYFAYATDLNFVQGGGVGGKSC